MKITPKRNRQCLLVDGLFCQRHRGSLALLVELLSNTETSLASRGIAATAAHELRWFWIFQLDPPKKSTSINIQSTPIGKVQIPMSSSKAVTTFCMILHDFALYDNIIRKIIHNPTGPSLLRVWMIPDTRSRTVGVLQLLFPLLALCKHLLQDRLRILRQSESTKVCPYLSNMGDFFLATKTGWIYTMELNMMIFRWNTGCPIFRQSQMASIKSQRLMGP